jgi:short-subunit dehydrogenase
MSEGSTIVNISSFSGLLGTFGYSSYAASKYAVIGLSEALRNELSPRNIRVSVLCPPDTDTPQLAEENRHKPPETKALSGKAGLLSPEFVAASLFRGLKKGKFIIIPGLQSRLIYLLKRLFPSVVYAMIDSTIRKVRNNQ